MYEYIKGKFVGINKDYIIVENNGIGYKIFTSGNTMANMPKIGEDTLIYLMQIVREDFIGLYGFVTESELEMFNKLITINGVGAKASLSLLSICSVDKLKYSIIMKDEKMLVKAPGIGKKMAQRIILELKDKISSQEMDIENLDKDNENYNSEEFDKNKKISDAKLALISLGYSEKEADKAVNMVDKNESIENIIKGCLKFLMN
ncbi:MULTISPECIES: Holliday junction branch migration protein RuvA [Clostridium]|uniref:Holliday junction branch migration protein RuvA n=1 Tax=Clostridium TaxID=1485 RepID=UPI00069ECDC7|nr:Holliday junction branch migration protein RuvA [Clostridium sp. DMHC 10]KOF55936.1 ATP-dependent DNA helicase RuvA [Clostridium sp. DMHC 10]MCD2345329.1 Holliday junction branch migration protein RuvA [Clostridium guangxiense]